MKYSTSILAGLNLLLLSIGPSMEAPAPLPAPAPVPEVQGRDFNSRFAPKARPVFPRSQWENETEHKKHHHDHHHDKGEHYGNEGEWSQKDSRDVNEAPTPVQQLEQRDAEGAPIEARNVWGGEQGGQGGWPFPKPPIGPWQPGPTSGSNPWGHKGWPLPGNGGEWPSGGEKWPLEKRSPNGWGEQGGDDQWKHKFPFPPFPTAPITWPVPKWPIEHPGNGGQGSWGQQPPQGGQQGGQW